MSSPELGPEGRLLGLLAAPVAQSALWAVALLLLLVPLWLLVVVDVS
jgi:hypothetical protein